MEFCLSMVILFCCNTTVLIMVFDTVEWSHGFTLCCVLIAMINYYVPALALERRLNGKICPSFLKRPLSSFFIYSDVLLLWLCGTFHFWKIYHFMVSTYAIPRTKHIYSQFQSCCTKWKAFKALLDRRRRSSSEGNHTWL